MENKAAGTIIGSPSAPYINSLARQGALFTGSYAVAHPSQPNYLALFSGSTQGVTGDGCPVTLAQPNLATELTAAGLTFSGYSESMPAAGYTGCTAGPYARKHNPWADFPNVPAAENLPFTAFPTGPAAYGALPTVSFVVPDLDHDMHDGTVAQGDAWLRSNLDSYVQWAKSHDSELLLTWDEDDNNAANQIPTMLVGAGVQPGTYPERITHYNVLRTLEAFYGLPPLGESAAAAPVSDVFPGPPHG
jgi:acid phosphatase